MTPLLISGLVAAGTEVLGSFLSSKTPDISKGKQVVDSFSNVLANVRSEEISSLSERLNMKGITSLEGLNNYQRNLEGQLLLSPEISGKSGPFTIHRDDMGQYSVLSQNGERTYLSKGSIAEQIAEELESVERMLDLSSQLPGASIDVLANQITAYPHASHSWSLGREIV